MTALDAPMKIVFISTSLTTGGAELMLLKLLQHLNRSRFNPVVVSLQSKGEVGPRIEALGIPVIALGMNPGIPNPLRLLALVNHLRKIKPVVTQTWMYHADLLGGLAARLVGCRRVVWGLRNSNLNVQLSRRSTLLVVKACAAVSTWLPLRILSCSIRAAEVHVAVGYRAGKIQVIPNGFDLGRFVPNDEARQSVRAELGVAAETPLVGLMARYDAQKNHVGFIEAAALIHQEMPEVHFVLAGGSVNAKNIVLSDAIRSLGLSTRMHLLGQRDDMPRLMAALDVLASSSYGEAFPNVLGEAMACGVPCVVTDVGDSAEIVGDTGRVVQSGDMKNLADRIVKLLSLAPEDKLALSQKARKRVEMHYEISNVAKRYEAFYERLVESD
jgi:glycosyltransferase involved in cell wall biosynthesis